MCNRTGADLLTFFIMSDIVIILVVLALGLVSYVERREERLKNQAIRRDLKDTGYGAVLGFATIWRGHDYTTLFCDVGYVAFKLDLHEVDGKWTVFIDNDENGERRHVLPEALLELQQACFHTVDDFNEKLGWANPSLRESTTT
jgi:hypothetical protein